MRNVLRLFVVFTLSVVTAAGQVFEERVAPSSEVLPVPEQILESVRGVVDPAIPPSTPPPSTPCEIVGQRAASCAPGVGLDGGVGIPQSDQSSQFLQVPGRPYREVMPE